MKALVIFASFLYFNISSGQDISKPDELNYKILFGEKYFGAYSYLSSQQWISDTLQLNGIDPDFAKAIVFPEIIRYSALQNSLEMQGLFTLYVQYGSSYANFSVGLFQMKPEFAELIERDAKNLSGFYSLRFKNIDNSNTPEARTARVNRLNTMNWQVQYLIGFIKIMDQKYEEMHWTSANEKLRFYATAYNFGFTKSEKEIRKKMNEKHFHTSSFRSNICYNYCSISNEYYNSKK